MQFSYVTSETEQAWDRHITFHSECITSKEQLKYWEDNFLLPNFNLNNGIYDPYHCAISAEWILEAYSPCEMHICWLEFDAIPCIIVPIYKHEHIAFAQGIRRFYRLSSHANGIKGMGVHLLAEVCAHFSLKYILLSPVTPFSDQLEFFMRREKICFGLHKDSNILSDHAHPKSWLKSEGRIAWIEIEYQEGISTWDRDVQHAGREDLGILEKPTRARWDVLAQQWKNLNGDHRDTLVIRKEVAPYSFLLQMYGGSSGIFVIDATSLAMHAFCASTVPQHPSSREDDVQLNEKCHAFYQELYGANF